MSAAATQRGPTERSALLLVARLAWHPEPIPAEQRSQHPLASNASYASNARTTVSFARVGHCVCLRIHGTNDVTSIGSAQSSGCFRMLNSAVMHLASITETGTTVTVVASLPDAPGEIVRAPEPPIRRQRACGHHRCPIPGASITA
jgi:L,D-transpeptidase-like protein